jgi:uncharacterized protein (UPF0303 family)
MDYAQLLIQLQQQEQQLQFPSFSNADAVAIGMDLYETAKERNLPITIDIMRNGQQLFHLSMPGTSPDNDQWVIRKCKLVNRFQASSFRVGTELRSLGMTLEERYELSHYEYAAHGGCFPIIIRDTGMVGTITVSGLAQEDDHALVVEAITKFLNK